MISFIIQFKYDSDDRLRNLLRGIIYLNHHFKDSEIIIIDQDDNADTLMTYLENYQINNAKVKSLQSEGPFHRSKVINEGIKLAKNAICLIYDCDILLPVSQIEASLLLASNGYDVVYPFTSPQYDIPQEYFIDFQTNYDFEKIKRDIPHRRWGEPDSLMLQHGHGGFGMMINKDNAGNLSYFNEEFNGWGFEDGEFLYRLDKFGAKVTRAWGPVFHVEHSRTLQHQHLDYTEKNNQLYQQIRSMDMNTLTQYYKQLNLIN